jgi:hypothetical protein
MEPGCCQSVTEFQNRNLEAIERFDDLIDRSFASHRLAKMMDARIKSGHDELAVRGWPCCELRQPQAAGRAGSAFRRGASRGATAKNLPNSSIALGNAQRFLRHKNAGTGCRADCCSGLRRDKESGYVSPHFKS